ncbi:MAG: hypothetical protein WC548_00370 [Candidatus Pacearchaeota archaeon]
MRKVIDYQIGRLEGDLTKNHKFIVEERDSVDGLVLVYHSHIVDNFGQPLHKKIVKIFSIKKDSILGGGFVFTDASILNFCDYSTDFGAVPQSVLEKFGGLLLPRYQNVGIERIKIDVDERDLMDWWKEIV